MYTEIQEKYFMEHTKTKNYYLSKISEVSKLHAFLIFL